MLALQGPDARAILARPHRRRGARADAHGRARASRASSCLVCGTGYTGEDGVELLIPPDGAAAVWDALTADGATPDRPRRARHAAPRGLLPPLRQRPVRGPQPDRGRPRLVLQARHGLHRLRRRCREPSRPQKLVPFAFTGPGIPRQGNPVLIDGEADGRGHERHAVALPRHTASAWRTFRSAATEPGTPIEVDVRGKRAPGRGAQAAALHEEGETEWPTRATPRT